MLFPTCSDEKLIFFKCQREKKNMIIHLDKLYYLVERNWRRKSKFHFSRLFRLLVAFVCMCQHGTRRKAKEKRNRLCTLCPTKATDKIFFFFSAHFCVRVSKKKNRDRQTDSGGVVAAAAAIVYG